MLYETQTKKRQCSLMDSSGFSMPFFRLSIFCFSIATSDTSPDKATDGAEICRPMVSLTATSGTLPKKERCTTPPNPITMATTATAFSNGKKRADIVTRRAFTTGILVRRISFGV